MRFSPHFQLFYFNDRLEFCEFFEWKIKRINNADLFSQPPLVIFTKGANISGGHCIYLSFYRSIIQFIILQFCHFIHPSIIVLSIVLSIYRSVCLSVCHFTVLLFWCSVVLSVCLSLYLACFSRYFLHSTKIVYAAGLCICSYD